MKRITVFVTACLLILGCMVPLMAQNNTNTGVVVPRLVNYSGKALDAQGRPLSGIAGVTFSIYKDQYDGAPLWLETQNVQADSKGNYTIQLGATEPEGLPLELFTSGEGRWLGIRVNSGEEQPRVLLLSVPYALKAADAQTLGGLPASAFMLAGQTAPAAGNPTLLVAPAASPTAAVSGTGTTDFLPLWTNSTGALGNSVLFQAGTGSTVKVGINTTTPAATLDVNGSENVHGILNMAAAGTATATAGKNSQPLDFTASAFNSNTKAAIAQKFQWQAEAVGNNTASAAGALSLLYASGTATPAETGLKIAKNGIITFAAGQTFPGTGGTVTSVGLTAPASDFTVTGAPVKSSGTLGIVWNIAPTSNPTPNAIVKRDANGGIGVNAIVANTGVAGYSASAVGVYGQSGGSVSGANGVEGLSVAEAGSGVAGFNNGNGVGVYGQGGTGVYGYGSTGVYAHGSSYGIVTDSNVQQARTAGGWVKAMAIVNGEYAPYTIVSCFNSFLAGAAATTPPCGFNLIEEQPGLFDINFGFQVNDRFLLSTQVSSDAICSMQAGPDPYSGPTYAYLDCETSGGNSTGFYASVFVF